MHIELSEKINSKKSIIGVIGLGYVGLPLCIRFSEVGFQVLGFDIDESKIEYLKNGKSFINHISNEVISRVISNSFEPTTDFSRIQECDAIIVCVPTPLNKHREPDLNYILETIDSIKSHIKPGTIFSLESTTYPGTTKEVVMPIFEESGFKIGKDLFLAYSPEREDPANKDFTTETIPKIVGGHTKECLDVAVCLYEKVVNTVVPVSSTDAAELTKLLENIYRAVNIGLVNELKVLTDKMGIDVYEVIDAAATKPFGFKAFYPGPGLGGHCIPIDPFYLTWKAKEYEMHTRFIELAGEINSSMPSYVVEKLTYGLNKYSKAVSGSAVLILGIAYKKNVDDMRESPSLKLLELINNMGGNVSYSDPFVSRIPKLRNYSFDLQSIELNKKNLQSYDAVILATDHDNFDYDFILNNAKLIIDTRGRYRGKEKNVIHA